jgi:hypothetical protein
MAVTERTIVKKLELEMGDDGHLEQIIAERLVEYSRDGTVVSTHFHRDAYSIASPDAHALLRTVLAGVDLTTSDATA